MVNARRRLPLVALLAAGALAIAASAAYAASRTAGAKAASDTLVVNINTGPATLDPRDMTSFFDTIGLNFYVRLMQYGIRPGTAGTKQFDPYHQTPYLAKSVAVSN